MLIAILFAKLTSKNAQKANHYLQPVPTALALPYAIFPVSVYGFNKSFNS